MLPYATPFKAYLGLGNALFQSGDYANAGTAFRQAAIDGANPAPAAALGELGRCFIKLGRPADAVETYRTAIDFAGPATTRVRSTPAWVRRFRRRPSLRRTRRL